MGLTVWSNGAFRTLDEVLVRSPGSGQGPRLIEDGPSPAAVWRTQPAVRTVVGFLARNSAHVALHAYERVSDTDRVRLADHPLSAALKEPNPSATGYELIHSTVIDLCLHDLAVWIKMRGPDGRVQLRRFPPGRVKLTVDGLGDVVKAEISTGSRLLEVDPASLVIFPGYSPDLWGPVSPMETLRNLLIEADESARYRVQLWRNGARMSGLITRPADAPAWSDPARNRFKSDWRARWSGDGIDAGGTPVLEDGMTFQEAGFSARDAQWFEGRKLTTVEVAAAYYVPPPMVGVLDNANYSNVKEFRSMLYVDTLGPIFSFIESRVDMQAVPEFPNTSKVYVEFNVAEKLEGNFEEQTSALQSAVGRPWMTPNEARGRLNMPSLDGDADELATPLNVLIGGQANPRDSAPKGRKAVRLKADDVHRAQIERIVSRFFERQASAVLSALGAKAVSVDSAWDADRWNGELTADLLRASLPAASAGAHSVLDVYDPSFDWSDEPMLPWLASNAERAAEGINETTRAQLASVAGRDEWKDEMVNVFRVAASSRASQIAQTQFTEVHAFGRQDAAKALGLGQKRWVVRSQNPRPAHAAMNGETVGLGDRFSNGARWPGDSSLSADDRAGCTCDIEFVKE